MVVFYHRFIPDLAGVLAPLHESLKCKPKDFVVTPESQEHFALARIKLKDATLLSFLSGNVPLALTTDASSVAVGGVLEQFVNDQWRPLAFFSRKWRPPELKYSTFDRELLAIYLAVRHFRHFVEGQDLSLYTDHKPLTFVFSKPAMQFLRVSNAKFRLFTSFLPVFSISRASKTWWQTLFLVCVHFLQTQFHLLVWLRPR